MKKHFISKGTEINTLYGFLYCNSFNGNLVFGDIIFDNGHAEKFSYTLSEIAHLMYEVDGKNHKVFWEDQEN